MRWICHCMTANGFGLCEERELATQKLNTYSIAPVLSFTILNRLTD